MAKKLNIKVTIEDIQLPLQVSTPDEEKVYRDAAAMIQRRIQRLRDAYPHLPNDKYYYVMAMLNTAVEAVKSEICRPCWQAGNSSRRRCNIS